jgi:hypothetical protein
MKLKAWIVYNVYNGSRLYAKVESEVILYDLRMGAECNYVFNLLQAK